MPPLNPEYPFDCTYPLDIAGYGVVDHPAFEPSNHGFWELSRMTNVGEHAIALALHLYLWLSLAALLALSIDLLTSQHRRPR